MQNILNKILASQIEKYIFKIIHDSGIYPKNQGWFNIHKSMITSH